MVRVFDRLSAMYWKQGMPDDYRDWRGVEGAAK